MPYVFSFCSSWFGPGTRRPWLVKAKAVALLWWPGSNSGDARWFHEKFVNFAPQMKWRLVGWLVGHTRQNCSPYGCCSSKGGQEYSDERGSALKIPRKMSHRTTAIQSKAKSPTSFFFKPSLGECPEFWTWLVYDPNDLFPLKLYILLCKAK